MASCELKPAKGDEAPREEGSEEDEELSDFCEADDSVEDPTFDVLEETRSALSKISLKKSKYRDLKKEIELRNEDWEEPAEVEIPELNEKDLKCFEMVEKLIKGDACTGDVVLFEQNVYEMFSIASRSATGPSSGTRLIAGRIVKESYGAAKQQHTFTIEVLWSKGEKPLPPLHPLLIKGRNLYRLKTMRQRWADEEQRKKVLQEKHARGSIARDARENRIQQKEVRKINRITRTKENKGKLIQAEQRNEHQPNPLQTDCQLRNIQPLQQSQHHPDGFRSKFLKQMHFQNESQIKSDKITTAGNYDNSLPQKENYDNSYQVPKPPGSKFQPSSTDPVFKPRKFEFLPSYDLPQFAEKHHQHLQQPCSAAHYHTLGYNQPPCPGAHHYRQPSALLHSCEWSPRKQSSCSNSVKISSLQQPLALSNYFNRSPPRQPSVCSNYFNRSPPRWPIQQRQLCRFYRQGRCHFGDNCKYAHD